MSSKLLDKLKHHVIVPQAITLKANKIKDIYSQEEEVVDDADKSEPLDLDLIPGHETSPDARPKLKYDERLVDYARSKKTVEMMMREEMSKDVDTLMN